MATTDSPETKEGITVYTEDLDMDLTEKEEPVIWQYLTPSRLRACRAAVLMYLIQAIIPEDQRWMYYMLLLHFQQDFYDPIYVRSILVIPVLLFFPIIPAGYIYGGTMIVDLIQRTRTEEDEKRYQKTENSPILYLVLFSFLFFLAFDVQPLVLILEACLGPIRSWSYVFIPLLPGLLILAEERDTINGFVPEGRRGISTAITFQAISTIFPRWFQWLFFLAFSVPNPKYPGMFVEWILYTAAWLYLDISPIVAYAAHLLINQYPHVNTWLRRQGGGPSAILRRERLGSLWFAITSLALHVLNVVVEPGMGEVSVSASWIIVWRNVTLLADLPYFKFMLRHWLPTPGKFTHQPLEDSDGLRLLRLLPQPRFGGFQIQCDMIHATLECAPSYTAISHTWGNPSEMKEIIINGSPIPVSPNVYSLLLAKRSAWRTVVVWIDSVCINQVDNKEKARQVALMRRIFEEASCTIGWLGDDENAGKAFGAINRFHSRRAKEASSVIDRLWAIFTKPWSNPIADGPLIEWHELENLVSNPWFERVWIVQEIAVSKKPILRHGNEEIEWEKFATTLFVLLFSTLSFHWPRSKFWESNGLVNALIVDNLRNHVDNVDYLKLKDMLKLGLRFNATLPIDKVYGLLGIVEERRTPFLHPNLSRTGSLGVVNSRAGHVWTDVMKTTQAINKLMGTINRSSNTREGRAMLTSTERGLRNFVALTEDLKRSLDYMNRFEGKPDIDSGPTNFRPDYSEKSTAENVYTYVARELVRERDFQSLFRLAGIGQSRNEKLESLPSWVPDWSTNLETYLLPRPTPLLPKGLKDVKNKKHGVRDGGPKILHVRGVLVGIVAHLSRLSEDLQNSSEDVFQQTEKDFDAQTHNYWEAWQMAFTHTGSRYATEVAVEQEAGGETVEEKRDAEETVEETIRKEAFAEETVQGEAAREEESEEVPGEKKEVEEEAVEEKGGKEEESKEEEVEEERVEDEGVEEGEVEEKGVEDEVEEVEEEIVDAEQVGKEEDLIELAFWRTVMANSVPKENRPPSKGEVNLHRSSVLGGRSTCAVQAALFPNNAQDYWKRFEEMNQKQTVHEHQTAICEEYLFIRRLQSSANSKFAHLVRNDVVPSFASYRLRFEYTTAEDGKQSATYFRGSKPEDPVPVSAPDGAGKRIRQALDMFTDREAGALSGYIEYVDYTIGRKFAVTHSGHMGLVPGGTEVGDVVIWLEEEALCLILRPTKGDNNDGELDEAVKGTGVRVEGKDDVEPEATFRFVGEAYIHELAVERVDKHGKTLERWFKLW